MTTVQVSPYDNAGVILQQAIAFAGDANGPNGILGNLLNPSQPGVIPLLNVVYRTLQDELIKRGVETFSKYGFILGIPPADTSNPSSQVWINYSGYFDGQEVLADFILPPDLLKPLELWERQSGNNFWVPMVPAADSLSTRPIVPFFNTWDYQTDTLFLPPANQTNDLKLKYLCYAPDLTSVSSSVLVPRCQTALAKRFLAEVAKQRGGLEMAAVWTKDGDYAVDMIVDRSARRQAYVKSFRQPFRMRRSYRGRSGN